MISGGNIYSKDSRLNDLLKKKICELIELRDEKYSIIKEYENSKDFYVHYDYVVNWQDHCQDLTRWLTVYSSAMEDVSFLNVLIYRKRAFVEYYYEDFGRRKNYEKIRNKILKYLGNNPKTSYMKIIELFGEDAYTVLDVMIENEDIIHRKDKWRVTVNWT